MGEFSASSSPPAPADDEDDVADEVDGVDDVDADDDDVADVADVNVEVDADEVVADDVDDDVNVTWSKSFLSFSLADSFKVFTATVLVPWSLPRS